VRLPKIRMQWNAAAWVTAAPFLLFVLPLVRGEVIYWGLPALQFIPWRHYAWELLRQGVWPLWNPLNGLGAPLLANYQLALFYPPALPLFLLDEIWGPAGLAWGFTFLIPLHLAWGAVGLQRLLHTLGIRLRGQIVAGLAFSLGGYLVARGSFFSMIWAAVWLPWILNGLETLLEQAQVRDKILSSLKISLYIAIMLLAGHAQVAWYALLFAGLWLLVRAWQFGRIKLTVKTIGIFAACGILALLLTAVQLFPTFEYLHQSQRAAAYEYETAMVYSFSPLRLLGYLIPDLFGNPGYGDFYGYATYWEDAVYLGLIPFFLALTTSVWLFKKGNRSNRLWQVTGLLWLMAIGGTVLALGSNTPIFPWLFRHIPTFEMFQAPARWMFWPTTAMAILAGFAADSWQQPGKKGRVVLNLVVFGGLILAAAARLGSLAMPEVEPGLLRGLILFGLTAAVSAFIARRLPTEGRMGRWGYAAGMWVMIDMLVAQAFLNPTIPAANFNTAHSQLEQINKTRFDGRIWIDPQVEYEIKFNRLFDFKDFHQPADGAAVRESLMPNLNLLDGISLVNNFDPLLPERYAAWQDWMETADPSVAKKWLTLANTGAELSINPQSGQQPFLTPLTPGPRAAWTNCAESATSPEAAFNAVNEQLEQDNQVDCVVLEKEIELNLSSYLEGSGSVTIVEETAKRLLLSVNSDSAGWLVVRDSWYPGWQSRVDGQIVPLYHADYLFKAVPLSDGNHQIALEYKPKSFTIGLWVSLVAWVVMGLAWYLLRRKGNLVPD